MQNLFQMNVISKDNIGKLILIFPFVLFLYPGFIALCTTSQYPVYFGKYSKALFFLNVFNVFIYFLYFFSLNRNLRVGKLVSLIILVIQTIIAPANAVINDLKYIEIVWILIRFTCGVALFLLAFESYTYKQWAVSSLSLLCSSVLLLMAVIDVSVLSWIKITHLRTNQRFFPESKFVQKDKIVESSVQVDIELPIKSGAKSKDDQILKERINNIAINKYRFRTANEGFQLNKEYVNLFDFHMQDIVMVGDSFVAGSGVRTEDAMGVALECLLQEQSKDKKVHVIAVPGIDLDRYLDLIKLVPSNVKVERVVVGFYLNDMPNSPYVNKLHKFINYSLNKASPSIRLIRDLWVRSMRLSLDQYHEQLIQNFNKKDISYNKRWATVVEELTIFYQLARERSLKKPILMIIPLTIGYVNYPLVEAHQDLTNLGRELGFDVLDLYPIFKEELVDGSQFRVSEGDNHFNAQVHHLVADKLKAIIK